ncbi:hypothetical protein PFISCL1PPCAC_14963, partial [Pristionchus fissidentatus]
NISFIRFVCFDILVLVKSKKIIKKLLDAFEVNNFNYSSSLRLAIWSCVMREDKDPSDIRFILKERLQSEKKAEQK